VTWDALETVIAKAAREEGPMERAGAILITIGVFVIFACPAIIAWQSCMWLRWGYWPPLSIHDAWFWAGLGFPSTGWMGVDKLIDWTFDGPLSLIAFLSGLAIVWLGLFCEAFRSKPKQA
jgi:hypothetical protein